MPGGNVALHKPELTENAVFFLVPVKVDMKIKQRPQIERKKRVTNLVMEMDEMFAPSTSKGAGKSKADRDRESRNLEQTPGKRLRKTTRAEKLRNQTRTAAQRDSLMF